MKKILYVNGCSHSCGAEISRPLSLREPKDLELSWGGQLASRHNLYHKNDAFSGQSNDEIFSTSVYSLTQMVKEIPSKDILVLIGWTSFERQYYIFENRKYSFVPGIHETPAYQSWPKIVRKSFENWILGVDDSDSINKFSLTYLNMINFCKINQLDYYFFNAITEVYYPARNLVHHLYKNSINDNLFKTIKEDENYLDPFNRDMSYYNYLKKRYDGFIDGRNHHFLPDAQQEWANLLDDKIKRFLK